MKKLHTKFIEAGYDGVFMFDSMDRKAKYAAREFNWQLKLAKNKSARDIRERLECVDHF